MDARAGQTLQEVALSRGIPIGDACGGNAACSTCHCYVVCGADDLTEMQELEDVALDKASGLRMESRLACQARISTEDSEVWVDVSEEGLQAYVREHGK